MIVIEACKKFGTRLGTEQGLTLVEGMVAAMVLAVGTLVTLTMVATAGRGQVAAERTQAAARAARVALEQMRSLDYDQLAMSSALEAGSIPAGEPLPPDSNARFNDASAPTTFKTRLASGATVTEDIVQPPTDQPGSVEPVPQDVALGEGSPIKLRIWKYVSWRDEKCPTSGGCPDSHDTKRVTVAVAAPVAAPSDPGPRNVVWMSSLVIDPNKGAPAADCAPHCVVADPDPPQKFYLYDTLCTRNSSYTQSQRNAFGDHATHKTSALTPGSGAAAASTTSACANSDYAPDLMGPDVPNAPPEGDPAFGQFRYSTDIKYSASIWGYGSGGATLMPTPGCAGSYDPTSSPNGMHNVHAWSTKEFSDPFKVSGLMALDLYVGTFKSGPGDQMGVPAGRGTICVTLIDRAEPASHSQKPVDTPIYSYYCSVRPWPLGRRGTANLPDGQLGVHLTGRKACRFIPGAGWPSGGKTIAAGHRLVFALSVCGSGCGGQQPSSYPLVLFYDHQRNQSKIDVNTSTPIGG